MKTEIKRLWIKRLRELPEKKHCVGRLRMSDGSMCHLGVLCELAREQGVVQRYGNSYNGYTASLPPEVINWAGLKHDMPNIPVDGRRVNIIHLNEGQGQIKKTFKEFASILHKAKAADIK
jgi:hypothetical protein